VSKIFVTLTRLAQQQQLQKVLSFLSQNESRHSHVQNVPQIWEAFPPTRCKLYNLL